MRSMLIVLAAAVSMALLACGVAAAAGTAPGATYTTGFEPIQVFSPGSINGQGMSPATWSVGPSQAGPPYDEAVTATNPMSGLQSFRMSNAVADGGFGNRAPRPHACGPGRRERDR